MRAHRRYLAIEASIGAVISAVLSIVFCVVIFGGAPRVPVMGGGGLLVDALPQGFMIALMSSLVPTLLTRARVRRGVIVARTGRSRLPANVALRALLFAVCAAVFSVVLAAVALSAGPADWPFATVLVGKTLYGALLGGAVAALATRAALADRAA